MATSRHPNHRPAATLPPELRRTNVPAAARAWVTRATGLTIAAAERLPGASTSAVHRLRFTDGTSLVLRRYVWPWVLQDEPIVPERELDALRHAARHNLPVPNVVAADITGSEIGDGVPAILMRFLPGRALASPDPTRLAEAAAAIHAVDPTGLVHEYFPWFNDLSDRPPPNAKQPGLWGAALELAHSGTPRYGPTFIHRDFHPGNVLWKRGQVTGVVDWANACRGPVGCDVATCRANLNNWAGEDVAERFVAAYEAILGEPIDPYWEIASVFERGSSPWSDRDIEDAERRLKRALFDH